MKALIAGANGQLGRSLVATCPDGVDIVALGARDLDIGDAAAVGAAVEKHRPDIVLNAAAYTAVDRAEGDEAGAHRVNAAAVGYLAAACVAQRARLVHVSTDFVFDGRSSRPYPPDAPTAPLGVYGHTKLAGEQAAGPNALIVRTAWVYSPYGGNFVATMLRLMAERPELRVVADQVGTPTYAPALAQALWALAAQEARGIFHYTDSGVASWFDFAVAIKEEALACGLLTRDVPVLPIFAEDYPTPARRPHFSVMDCRATFTALGGPAPHWRQQLRRMLGELTING